MNDNTVLENRRRLLKIIASTGGAVAASAVIPGQWLKPVVEMGVLPAHAQLSGQTITISNLEMFPTVGAPSLGADSQDVTASAPDFTVNFNWESRCDLPENSYLWVKTEECGYLHKGSGAGKKGGPWKIWGKPSGKNYKGSVDFPLYPCGPPTKDSIQVWLEGCEGLSNKLSKKFNWPGDPI